MTSPVTAGEFLKWLIGKIVVWKNIENASFLDEEIKSCDIEFLPYKITMHDFNRLLECIISEKLLILPIESLSGKVDGYGLYSIQQSDMKITIVMAFTKMNIPAQYTLESLFQLCHTTQNKHLLESIKNPPPLRTAFVIND